MLIFEGPDNSGKSTVSSYISHELGIPLHHFGKPPKTIDELKNRIDFMFNNHDRYIFDRIPLISEQVYSILRDVNLMSVIDEAGWHYNRLRSLNPIIIYCRPPLEVILEKHQGKDYDSPEHLKSVEKKAIELIKRYDQVMSSEYLPPHWSFDYTKQEHDVFLAQVEEELRDRDQYLNYFCKHQQLELPI